MRILVEFLLQVASDVLGRRIRRNQFRVFSLEGLELFEKHVKFIVAEGRGIIYIIPSVCLIEYASELVNPDICLYFIHNLPVWPLYGETNYKITNSFP